MYILIFQKIALLTLRILTAHFSFGQNIQLSKNTHVSVITCGVGNESYSLLDTRHMSAGYKPTLLIVYNMAHLTQHAPNFVMKFIKGFAILAVAHSYADLLVNIST
jgi:hypothetical protein